MIGDGTCHLRVTSLGGISARLLPLCPQQSSRPETGMAGHCQVDFRQLSGESLPFCPQHSSNPGKGFGLSLWHTHTHTHTHIHTHTHKVYPQHSSSRGPVFSRSGLRAVVKGFEFAGYRQVDIIGPRRDESSPSCLQHSGSPAEHFGFSLWRIMGPRDGCLSRALWFSRIQSTLWVLGGAKGCRCATSTAAALKRGLSLIQTHTHTHTRCAAVPRRARIQGS